MHFATATLHPHTATPPHTPLLLPTPYLFFIFFGIQLQEPKGKHLSSLVLSSLIVVFRRNEAWLLGLQVTPSPSPVRAGPSRNTASSSKLSILDLNSQQLFRQHHVSRPTRATDQNYSRLWGELLLLPFFSFRRY